MLVMCKGVPVLFVTGHIHERGYTMKKFITLALVLVMALGLAAPALAYSSNTAPAAGSSLFTLDINIVRYTDAGDYLSGWITAPHSNEGYVVGQVVAVVGALNVPSNADFYGEGYRQVYFSGSNVNLNVVDNYLGLYYSLRETVPDSADAAGTNWHQWWYDGDDTAGQGGVVNVDKLYHWAGGKVGGAYNYSYIPSVSGAKTYRWLCFGKVTGDNATMSFGITPGMKFNLNPAAPWLPGTTGVVGDWLNILDDEYSVIHTTTASGGHGYSVFENLNGAVLDSTIDPFTNSNFNLLCKFETTSKNVGDGLILYGIKGFNWRVEVSGGELIFWKTNVAPYDDKVSKGDTLYNTLVANYTSVVEDILGFSVYNKANTLKKGDFEKLANSIAAKVTVDIEPWTPYVQVPEQIVVDPPKTGETASVLGFVMIVMAAAAAFVAKKVRA